MTASVGFLGVLQCSWLFQDLLFFHHLQDSLIPSCFLHPHSHIFFFTVLISHHGKGDMFFIPTCFFLIPAFICIMTQLFTFETSDICFIFLDLSFTLLTLLLFIFQVPTIGLLVPILSAMVAPSFKEPSFVPFLDVSTLIATTLHIQGHFIFRPTMFHLELQVVLCKPFLDFIHGYQC